MTTYRTIFTTERGEFHQQRALTSAPPELDITMMRSPSPDEIVDGVPDAVYFISERTGTIDAALLARLPQLKLILRLGSMSYDIDLEAAKDAGVIVCYQPNVGVIRVAEHVIMQMLAVAKKLYEVGQVARDASDEWGESHRTDEDTFAYNWSNRQGIGQLVNRTVGILGFGEIGAEVARRLQGWGCEVLYNKRRRLPESVEADLRIAYAEADDLIAQSDYLVNMLPYFPNTDQSLNAATFAAMKDGAILVSAGSGSVIDEAALAEAVRSGKLAGVALDTYEWEPIRADNPLRQLALAGANVVLTPHTAAGSYTALIADRERLEDYSNIMRHLRGEPIRNRLA
ncbi:MAG: NAD(P)-dependent oxidoreductase [Chloroflexota bacterium]